MSRRKMENKLPGSNLPKIIDKQQQETLQHAGASLAEETRPASYVLWFAVAIALAGTSYLLANHYSSSGTDTSALTMTVPESYAVCTDPGKIYTVDDAHPNADCLLVHKDEIRVTGTIDDLNKYWEEYQNEVIKTFYGNEPKAKKALNVYHQKPGSIIVPGFADAHAHLIEYGFKMQLQLDSASSLDEILDILEAYVEAHPEVRDDPDIWIQGMGWDQTRWSNWSGEFPTSEHLALRESLKGLPMSLSRVDGHALWVSRRALELTKQQLPGEKWPSDDEVSGGQIIRLSDGEPAGVFLDNAMALIDTPSWTPDQMDSFLELAVQDALKVGLTSVHDAASVLPNVEVFKSFADDGRLPIRIYAMGNSENTTYWGGSIPRLQDYGQDERLNLKSIKLYTDGALGSWGAALLEPYSDKPSTSGIMRISPEALEEIVQKFWDDGWGINIHCIGDRANKVVLDVFESVLTAESKTTGEDILSIASRRRPRIEHAQIMRLGDVQRAGRLGVITSVQPTHATSDMWYAETRLGPDRIQGAYAYQTLLQASPHKVLPLGSDFPVEGINPLLGFYAAVSRLDIHGNSPHGKDGWYSSEKLSRAQALKGMTLDAAYASFDEQRLGSLTPGKKADYVVLDRDIMSESVPEDQILQAVVQATIVDGRVAYGGL